MLSKAARKDAIRQYRERATARGIFAVRCTASGAVWVGTSTDLRASYNACWFMLRHGKHRNADLQEQWNRYGADAFCFDTLEQLDENVTPLALPDLLKEKQQHWTARLDAGTLLR